MPRKIKLTKAQAQAELERRLGKAPELTPENIARGHLRQLEMFRALETHDHILAVCARQVGKTEFNMGALGLTAMKTPGAQCLYLGLDDGAAAEVFETKWKDFCKRFRLPVKHAGQVTSFENGSRVVFGGLTHAKHAATYLGKSMAGGICVIDEGQDQPALIRDAVVNLIGPMLAQRTVDKPHRGKLVITGTCPAVHAGYFWEIWRQGLDENLNIVPGADPYARFNISRFENVHLGGYEGARRELDIENATNKTTDDSPVQQRNWFGNYRVVDATITAFGYQEANTWKGASIAPWSVGLKLPPGKLLAVIPPEGIDCFAIGLDPAATTDRHCIVACGWSSKRPMGLWQVAEWTTEPGSNATRSQWLTVLKLLVEHYRPVIRIIRDDGSTAETDDASLREFSLVIEPAKKGKGSKGARIERARELLADGRMHVIDGSELQRDLQLARLEPEARAVGEYKWTSDVHPDCGDAFTYLLPAYLESPQPPPLLTTEQRIQHLLEQQYRPPVQYGYHDPLAVSQPQGSWPDTQYAGPTE